MNTSSTRPARSAGRTIALVAGRSSASSPSPGSGAFEPWSDDWAVAYVGHVPPSAPVDRMPESLRAARLMRRARRAAGAIRRRPRLGFTVTFGIELSYGCARCRASP
jgi:hypothetical protein